MKPVSRSTSKTVRTGKNLKLFQGTKELKGKGFVSTSDGYIYISRPKKGRTYWVLSRLPEKKRPKIFFNDKKQSIKIGNNKIVYKSNKSYNTAKKHLHKYSKKIKRA